MELTTATAPKQSGWYHGGRMQAEVSQQHLLTLNFNCSTAIWCEYVSVGSKYSSFHVRHNRQVHTLLPNLSHPSWQFSHTTTNNNLQAGNPNESPCQKVRRRRPMA